MEEIIKKLEEALAQMKEGDRVSVTIDNLTMEDIEYIIYKIESQ